MKKLALSLALALVALAGTARAEIGTADAVPAATLLLPYFEVDLGNPDGVNTIITINNASASAGLAHVTLWTDESIPTLNFDLYLTGYDVQRIDLRDVFAGNLPVTADDGADPTDSGLPTTGISNQGPLSQDINFPTVGAPAGPCDEATVYSNPELRKAQRRHLRRAHTGRRSGILNGCVGSSYGDRIARGYITVDSISQCTTENPNGPNYFVLPIADKRNILWGDYEYVHPAQNARDGGTMVHVEACNGPLYVGNGAGLCPFAPGDYTFYGRLVGFVGTDQREPLATTFATRYMNGGLFNGGTDVVVWRDTKEPNVGKNAKHGCQGQRPDWFPLDEGEVVAFDEQEDPTELCAMGECFPVAAQRVPTSSGSPFGEALAPPAAFGWLYLNLNHGGGSAVPDVAQAWVASTQSALGRFKVGWHAIALDNATTTEPGGYNIFGP